MDCNICFPSATKTKLSEAKTTIKKSEMDLKYVTKVLQDKEKTQMKSDTSYQKNKQNLENKEKEVKDIEVCEFKKKKNCLSKFLFEIVFYV